MSDDAENERRYHGRMTKILLVDDDRRHSELLQAYCRRFGMQVDCAYDGEQGLSKLAVSTPDLVLLDIMMPGMDGFEFCRQVRKTSNIPIIMLTARGDVIDRVSGLELGADDYVGKPFEPRELVARIQSILRRADTAPSSEKELQFGELRIDNDARCAYLADERLALTSMEFELIPMQSLVCLPKMNRQDQVLMNRMVWICIIISMIQRLERSRYSSPAGSSFNLSCFVV